MRESLPLAVSPAPLQDRHIEVNEERDGGKDTSISKEQYRKSARRINARKRPENAKKGGR